MCVSPGYEVCQWPHYARTFGLGSTPDYPPAGNCVPVSCLAVCFAFFNFFAVVVKFFFFFLVSDLQLVQIMLAAVDCRKKKSEQKKKALPKPKDLKTKNPYGEEWREDPIVLEAHGIYFSL